MASELLLLQCQPPSHPSQDAPMPPQPSDAYERLRDTIAKRMGMRPIEQLPEASRCECCGACELQQTLGEFR
jgi:hypothetical protein